MDDWTWLLAFMIACTIALGAFGWWERKYHPERFVSHAHDDDYDDSRDCCGGGVQEEWR